MNYTLDCHSFFTKLLKGVNAGLKPSFTPFHFINYMQNINLKINRSKHKILTYTFYADASNWLL